MKSQALIGTLVIVAHLSFIEGSPQIFGTTLGPDFKRQEGEFLNLLGGSYFVINIDIPNIINVLQNLQLIWLAGLQGCFELDKSVSSDLLEEIPDVENPLDCQYKCSENSECFRFVWITPIVADETNHKKCQLRKDGTLIELLGAVSGPKTC